MNLIEPTHADNLAVSLFDDVVTPLSKTSGGQERRRRFTKRFEASADSYFERPPVTAIAGASFDFPGGGAINGLIDALVSFWVDQGDTDLAIMKPRLLEIAAALEEENEQASGEIDIFCYAMF